jgi:hypothetical protein
MISCKQDSRFVKKTFFILLQILLTLIFLTIFFFTYVNYIEKEAFKTQINLIVDDITNDINIKSFIPPGKEKEASIIISGTLDFAEDDKKVSNQNNKIKNKAMLWVIIGCAVLLLFTVILVIAGYCIPFHIHLKDAIVVLFFMALTEFIFLVAVTKNYLFVNPATVRQEISDSIQKYIKNR